MALPIITAARAAAMIRDDSALLVDLREADERARANVRASSAPGRSSSASRVSAAWQTCWR
jgi:rhodanese-related sulfurtransferase